MAQAQYDEFVRLRKTWTDALTARKQAYWETPVASVAPVTPAVPTTPAPVSTPQVPTSSEVIQWVKDLWWDVQNRQNTRNVMTWKGGTVTPSGAILNADWSVTPAPVETSAAPVTPVPTPTTPVETTAPVDKNAEIKAKNEAQMAVNKQQAELRQAERDKEKGVQTAEALKLKQEQEAPIDYTQAKGREQDIINNLNTFKAQNMTPEQIIKASDYQNATPEKKALIEPYLKQQVPTASAMYNAIANKMEIPLEQQRSGAYRVANNRFQRANTYASMTPSQVSQAMNDTKLIEWSQTWEDMKTMNPKLAQDVKALRIVNNNKPNIFTYVNNPDWTPVKVNNLEKQFVEQYSEDHPDIVEQLKKIYATPSYDEMISKINTPEVKSIQDKASSIEWELNTLKTAMESVSKDVETELAWSGATGSRIALEKASRWEDLQKQYDAKLRDYTTQYNKANDLINRNTEIYKYSQEQNKAMQSALAWVATEQYKNKLALENAMFQNTLQQGNAQFQTIWDKVYKVQNWQMTDTWIKAEPNTTYQAVWGKLLKIKWDTVTDTGISTITPEAPKSPEWKQDTSGNWYNANSSTSPAVQTSQLSPTAISQISTRLQGNNVQCGMVTNDYNSKYFPDAPRMWDTYESKIATVNAIGVAPVPQVWGNFVMDTGTSTGHTGIVTSVDLANGTFTATDANKSGSKDGWPLQTSTYKITPKVTFSNAPVTQWATTWWFTDSDIAVLGSVAKLDKQGKQTLNENWLTERDWANFNAWLLPPTAKQKQESQVVVDRVDDILKWDWTDAVWPFLWKSRVFTWWGTDRKVTELKVQALKDLLAMANLDKIKGAMSDKDIEFLRNTATYLSTDLSESEFEKTLNEIKTKYANIAWWKPTTWTAQVSSTNTVAGESDYFKYE